MSEVDEGQTGEQGAEETRRRLPLKLIAFLAYSVVVMGAMFILAPESWYAGLFFVAIGLAVVLMVNSPKMEYECPYCERRFEISGAFDLATGSGVSLTAGREQGKGKKHLKCPGCNKWVDAVMVPKD